MKLITYSDGGARGNPGPGAGGAIVIEEGKIIWRGGKYLGTTTNNQAEYTGLILALEKAHGFGASEVEARLDSELLVKQCKREYKVRDAKLAPLYLKVCNLMQVFKKISFIHVPREKNKEADAEVNKAIDKEMGV